jgi:regulator of sigma E protease
MLSWLAPIIVFGLVVLVHELGHFIAAKSLGVYAPRFSIGFGRAIWRRRRGETEYIIGWLPLGGYVRMASREDEATAFLEGGSETTRAATAIPEIPAMHPVPTVGASGAPAVAGEGAAVKPATPDWDPEAMIPFGPKPVPEHRWFESKPIWARLIILMAGVTMNALLALVVSVGIFAGYGRPYRPAVVDSVVAGRPAAAAGMLAGDSIVSVGGEPVRRWTEVTERIVQSPGKPLSIEVVRGGQRLTLQITPELVPDTNLITGQPEMVAKIGAATGTRVERDRLTIGESLSAGWNATVSMGADVIRVVKGLVTGQVSMRQLGGPIQIARTSVEAARSGPEALLLLIAFLSINVAILNLLPIPILDGGQILLNVAESIKGSAFSARTREYILRAGLVAIALLFALVMFNDIKGLLGLFSR